MSRASGHVAVYHGDLPRCRVPYPTRRYSYPAPPTQYDKSSKDIMVDWRCARPPGHKGKHGDRKGNVWDG